MDRIKRKTHRGDTATTSSDGGITQSILDAINDSRRDIMLALPRRWQRKTNTVALSVAGGSTYALASDVLEPFLFRYTLNSKDYFLEKVEDEREFYKKVSSSSATSGLPKYYFDAGVDSSLNRQIIVFPTPDQSITLTYHYYKTWATEELTTAGLASQIPEIPLQFHNAVWKGGKYYFLQEFDDPAQVAAKQDYAEALAQIEILENLDLDTVTGFILGPMSVKRH